MEMEIDIVHPRSLNRRNTNITSTQWINAINSLIFQPISSNFLVSEIDFSREGRSRYTITERLHEPLKRYFPWFHGFEYYAYRQTLGQRTNDSMRILLEAINHFFHRDYSYEDIQFLHNYYQNMEIPPRCHCLSSIIDVYEAFREQTNIL